MVKSFILLILLGSFTLKASDFDADEVSFQDFESELLALEEKAMKQVEVISDIVSTSQAAPVGEKVIKDAEVKAEKELIPEQETSNSQRSRRIRSR